MAKKRKKKGSKNGKSKILSLLKKAESAIKHGG